MFWLESLGFVGLFIGMFLAATVVPFSSDALYIAILVATGAPVECLIVGTAGNWLGSVTTYFLGRLAKWEWVESVFRVSREKLEKQKARVDKYGVWLALISWVPIIGDIVTLALGVYRTAAVQTCALLLVGKFARLLVWNLIISAF